MIRKSKSIIKLNPEAVFDSGDDGEDIVNEKVSNKQSAKNSRLRKKIYLKVLEENVNMLEEQVKFF